VRSGTPNNPAPRGRRRIHWCVQGHPGSHAASGRPGGVPGPVQPEDCQDEQGAVRRWECSSDSRDRAGLLEYRCGMVVSAGWKNSICFRPKTDDGKRSTENQWITSTCRAHDRLLTTYAGTSYLLIFYKALTDRDYHYCSLFH
jgi:hypothetical protein